MEPKTLIFDKKCVIKNMFHRCVVPITINKVDIKTRFL